MVGYLTLIIIWIVALYGVFSCNYKSINILSCFVVFQNFVLVLISGMIEKMTYSLIVLTKEVYVVLVILFALFRRKRLVLSKFDLGCYLSILVLLVLSIIRSNEELVGVLTSFRQLYLPFMFYLMGKTLSLSCEEVKKTVKFFVRLSFIVVIFGIFEWSTGDWIWSHTDITKYYEYKGFSRFVYGDSILHGGVYSYDFYPLFVFRRMISFMVDPVILGQLLSASVILLLFGKDIIQKQKMWYIEVCILLIGLFLTFTKGGIMIFAIAFVALTRKIWKKYLYSKIALVGALISAVLLVGFFVSHNQSTLNHINGLIDGLSVLKEHIFGVGIGGYGNLASLYGEASAEGSGESFIGSLVAQTGIIGIALYGYFFYNLFHNLRGKDDLSVVVFWLNLALFVTDFFNNTAISFTNCYIFFVLAGCCISPSYSKKNLQCCENRALYKGEKAIQY